MTCTAQAGQIWLKNRSAFTLLELLAATAILSILMLMLFSFFDQTIKAWQGSEKQVDAFREARAAMHFIARDLRAMVVNDQLPFLLNKEYTVPGEYDPDLGDSVFFISAQSEESQPDFPAGTGPRSDLCAVGYYMVHTRDGLRFGASRTLSTYSSKLLRYFKSSNETWTGSGNRGIAPLFAAFAQAAPPASPEAIAAILFVPASGSNIQSADEMIARNIVDFRLRLYDASMVEMDSATVPENQKPHLVEVEFYTLNYDTAARFRNASQAANKQDWLDQGNRLFKQHAQRFVTRVRISD